MKRRAAERGARAVKSCKGCEWFRRPRYGRASCSNPNWRRMREDARQAMVGGRTLCKHDTRKQSPMLTCGDHTPWRDPKTGRVYAVSCGFSGGRTWYTAHAQVRGGRPRFTSPALPVRQTREEALEDLRRYAQAKGWEEVGTP